MKEKSRVYLVIETKYGSVIDLTRAEMILTLTGLQDRAGKGGKKHG